MTGERETHVKTILDFMNAAQTVLAVYGSPDGPVDPLACYNIMSEILEDPALLRAQLALAQDGKVILALGEQNIASLVFVGGGGIGPPAFLNEDDDHVRTETSA